MKEALTNDPVSIAAEIASELRARPWRWCQHAYTERRVAMGAVSTRHCLAGFVYARYPESEGLKIDVRDAFEQRARLIEPMTSLGLWNDHESRTVEDVIDLCERMARS